MPMCFFGRLVDQLNKGVSFRNLKDRFTDRRAVVRRDPNSAAIRLQVEGDTGIQALAFNGELSLCCHRASPPVPCCGWRTATGVGVSASPVLPVFGVMSDRGKVERDRQRTTYSDLFGHVLPAHGPFRLRLLPGRSRSYPAIQPAVTGRTQGVFLATTGRQ